MGNESGEGLPVGSVCQYDEIGLGSLEVEVLESNCDEMIEQYKLRVMRVLRDPGMPIGTEFDCQKELGAAAINTWGLTFLRDAEDEEEKTDA